MKTLDQRAGELALTLANREADRIAAMKAIIASLVKAGEAALCDLDRYPEPVSTDGLFAAVEAGKEAIDPPHVSEQDGTPVIAGYKTAALKVEIDRISRETSPMGDGLGMGVRAFSKSDLQFILTAAQGAVKS